VRPRRFRPEHAGGTPLRLYILKEAAHRAGRERLGRVGGRIVGEVLVGLLDADPNARGWSNPGGGPPCPRQAGTFTMADLIALTAGDG